MIIRFLEDLLHWNEEEEVLDAEYEPFRDQLSLAGLSDTNPQLKLHKVPGI